MSNDDFLEDKEDCQNWYVPCCVDGCTICYTHTREQFLKLSVGLGLVLVSLFWV